MSTYKDSSLPARQYTLKQLKTPGGHECKGKVCHREHTWKEISALVGASESVVHRDWREMRGTLRNPATRRRETLMDRLEEAPCRDNDKTPMDWFMRDPLKAGVKGTGSLLSPLQTYSAWLVCTECPVVDECYEMVRPTEYFDGVCGKRVWSNGRDVTDRFLDLLAERDGE